MMRNLVTPEVLIGNGKYRKDWRDFVAAETKKKAAVRIRMTPVVTSGTLTATVRLEKPIVDLPPKAVVRVALFQRKAVTKVPRGENAGKTLTEYFVTNETILNIQVQPFRDTPPLDVANMVQPGQVLEIAIRDVSAYESFEAFDSVREPFVDMLLAQPGVLQEFEYRSVDGRYYVGMTLYENAETFQAIMSNPDVVAGPEIAALMSYPPLISQIGVPFAPAE